jgi:hypothetical protein
MRLSESRSPERNVKAAVAINERATQLALLLVRSRPFLSPYR